jgi:hypothetical protein
MTQPEKLVQSSSHSAPSLWSDAWRGLLQSSVQLGLGSLLLRRDCPDCVCPGLPLINLTCPAGIVEIPPVARFDSETYVAFVLFFIAGVLTGALARRSTRGGREEALEIRVHHGRAPRT